MAFSFLDDCGFTPTGSGTSDFVVSSVLAGGYQLPATAGAVNTSTYRYRAYSADQSQWEIGFGVWTSSTSTLTRVTVTANSAGTTAKIAFSSAPNVVMGILAASDVFTTQTLNVNDTSLATMAAVFASGTTKAVAFSRNFITASGSQSITGVGFKPKGIMVVAAINATAQVSVGFADNSGLNYCIYNQQNLGAGAWGPNTTLICGLSDGTNGQAASIASFDSDGFTLTWTHLGATSSATFQCYAICWT